MTASPPLPAPDRATILLVDDEADILVALGDLLDTDYRVLSCTEPARALTLIEAEPDIAVIVSDQRMPGMAGNQFLAAARQICRAEALLLTGYADLDAVISAVNEGRIAGYVHKPWEPEALKGMIAAAVVRYRLRRALAFERAVFTGLAEQTDRAITVLDAEGRTLRTNRVVVHPCETDGFGENVHAGDLATIASQRSSDTETLVQANGAPCWIRTQRIPFTVEGLGRHLLRIESDETSRRLTEQKLLHAEKLQALGTLAGGIAHDFNNLLAAVLGNLELASRTAEAGTRLARYLGNATDAARRGTGITRRLLSFTRQRDLTATLVDPNVLVREMEDLVARSMSGVVTLGYALDPEIGTVRVDADQLELALLNLCINARDAMPGGGLIAIATGRRLLPADNAHGLPAGCYAAISVRDAGEGMPPEVQARAFEPFFTTKAPGKGTGLGLPMVNAMTEAAGGAVEIASTAGAGTTVTLLLPLADGMADPPAASPAEGPGDARSLSIVLAEDDAEVRAVATAYLEELGHRVRAAASGAEALALIEADGPDLLLTDYAMPGLSGLETARAAAHARPGLPVMLMTGFAEVSDMPAGITVLAKPFDRDALSRAIRVLVGPTR